MTTPQPDPAPEAPPADPVATVSAEAVVTPPEAPISAGSLQVGDIVAGKRVVAVQIDSNVTVAFDDGSQQIYDVAALVQSA